GSRELLSTSAERCSSTAIDLSCGSEPQDNQAGTDPHPQARPPTRLECRAATEVWQGLALHTCRDTCRAGRTGTRGGPGGAGRAHRRHVVDRDAFGRAGAGADLRRRMDGPMTTYAVTVSRDEPWWVAVVAGLPGGATEARRLDQLETEVRDLIAGLTDVDEDAFDLNWEYSLPPKLEEPVHRFLAAKARRQAAEQDYRAAQEHALH